MLNGTQTKIRVPLLSLVSSRTCLSEVTERRRIISPLLEQESAAAPTGTGAQPHKRWYSLFCSAWQKHFWKVSRLKKKEKKKSSKIPPTTLRSRLFCLHFLEGHPASTFLAALAGNGLLYFNIRINLFLPPPAKWLSLLFLKGTKEMARQRVFR